MSTNNVTYEIIRHIGTIAETDTYTKEINMISWNGREPVYDLRTWKIAKDKTKTPLKGISLNTTDLHALKDFLSHIDLEV